MQLEYQVTNLELSKKLKELGVKQDSLFVWEYYDDRCHGVKFIPYAIVPNKFNDAELFSAFTASELLEMVPCENHNSVYRIDFGKEFLSLSKEMGGRYYSITDLKDYPDEEYFYKVFDLK